MGGKIMSLGIEPELSHVSGSFKICNNTALWVQIALLWMETENPKYFNSCDRGKGNNFALFIKRLGFGEFSSLSRLRKQIPWTDINSTVFWFCSK